VQWLAIAAQRCKRGRTGAPMLVGTLERSGDAGDVHELAMRYERRSCAACATMTYPVDDDIDTPADDVVDVDIDDDDGIPPRSAGSDELVKLLTCLHITIDTRTQHTNDNTVNKRFVTRHRAYSTNSSNDSALSEPCPPVAVNDTNIFAYNFQKKKITIVLSSKKERDEAKTTPCVAPNV
jgi:hypothetical protein